MALNAPLSATIFGTHRGSDVRNSSFIISGDPPSIPPVHIPEFWSGFCGIIVGAQSEFLEDLPTLLTLLKSTDPHVPQNPLIIDDICEVRRQIVFWVKSLMSSTIHVLLSAFTAYPHCELDIYVKYCLAHSVLRRTFASCPSKSTGSSEC